MSAKERMAVSEKGYEWARGYVGGGKDGGEKKRRQNGHRVGEEVRWAQKMRGNAGERQMRQLSNGADSLNAKIRKEIEKNEGST